MGRGGWGGDPILVAMTVVIASAAIRGPRTPILGRAKGQSDHEIEVGIDTPGPPRLVECRLISTIFQGREPLNKF